MWNAIGLPPIRAIATARKVSQRFCDAPRRRYRVLPPNLPALSMFFSHGQFMQAVRSVVVDTGLDDRAKIRGFWRKGEPPAISNGERVNLAWSGERWTL